MISSALKPCSMFSRAVRVAVITFAVLAPALLFAQGYFGTVSGLLTDPSGAVVQNAKVTLTDQQKGYVFKTVSDNAGRYLFRAVSPGVYSVTAEMKGFEKAVVTNIKVDVDDDERPTSV